MGLAASQANFLALTARKSDIGLELQRLSSSKEALTRDMQKVTREYRDALSTKTLKWSGNSGVTYTDLNYSMLMKPGTMTNNSPYLITNSSGQVVVDEEYKKYADMIADNGGKYDGETRYNILSSLTGLSVDTLKLYDSTKADIDEKNALVTEADNAREKVPHQNWSNDQIISKLLSPSALGYTKSAKMTSQLADSITNSVIKNLCGKGYFASSVEDNKGGIKESLQTVRDDYKTHTDSESYKDMTVGDFINSLVSIIKNVTNSGDTIRLMIDTNNNNKGTQSDYEAADTAYKEAQAAYQSAVSANAEVFTGPKEKEIEFYDQIFQAIADMGCAQDIGVANTEYLNLMLQNNSYYITTMTENKCFNEDEEIDDRNYKYYYDTEFAENDPNIFKVNDSSAHEEALVKYEYEKGVINEKETRIDTRMKNLETEQSAISKMLESIDRVKNENIERTFALWS